MLSNNAEHHTKERITMQFQPSFNIWEVPQALYKHIQPGQWIYAGSKDNKGIFLGVKPSGIVVCAWHNNAKAQGKGKYSTYIKTLRQYATNQGK